MHRVDITADLNGEDDTGFVWTFLDEALEPATITPGALVVAGDEDAAAVCQVLDLVPAGDGTIVHLRMLPGLVENCVAAGAPPSSLNRAAIVATARAGIDLAELPAAIGNTLCRSPGWRGCSSTTCPTGLVTGPGS